MQSTTNQLMHNSIIAIYLMRHMWYIAVAGLLSYNLAEIFKIKHESGFLIRAGLMSLMSFAMIPVALYLAEDMNLVFYVVIWGVCFFAGLVFATYGARKLQAKFSLFFSRFTVKNKIRKGSKTDIRYMDKELPNLPDYNPHKFINLKKGVFIGLDERVKPIYLLLDYWYKRHFLIVGATRAGKGVAMQGLGVQSLMLGETVVFLDPKGDQYMPHILKAQCDKQGIPYHYINLTKDEPQINLIADFSSRDLKNCLVEAFSQREMGAESDVYRKNEQEFLENLANFIVEQNSATSGGIRQAKSLAELCNDYEISRYADNYKSSVSDLNKLSRVSAINAANASSLAALIEQGGCIYIVGDLLDETMKKIQRFIFCRVVQLARNYSNEADHNGTKEQNITVFADELVAHISRFVAESYTVSLGWGLKIVSAIQSLKLLKGAPADIDPEFLLGAIFDNSQNKLFYRADDIATADFLSDMTGKIQVEDEQKVVTRNSLNSEKLDRETRLIPSERNLYDRNMILKLKLFQAIFCASVPNRSAIASLCKTSPIPAPANLNGKEIIQVNAGNPRMSNKETKTINSTQNNQAQGKPKTFSEFIEREAEQKQRNQSNLTNAVTNHGEHHANNQSSATSDNSSQGHNQVQKTSTSQSDYLF
ncbi:MAG: type IV secretion system DNA-binding domain-containing protein [Burkholderiales bacterium]|nr:type IV secretion system DNA-binding domain-containing protein [Burkholderiales bacterium]MBP9768570.1 type IV secretion system DNA-binding domain-containing protein [Burkholderiales bacterium]